MGLSSRNVGSFLLFLFLFLCFISHCASNATRFARPSDRHRFIHRRYHGLRQLFRTDVKDWPDIILKNEAQRPRVVRSSEDEVVEVEAGRKESAKSTANELPPMDAAVVNDLTQPQMPTFDEFQAMVSDENQQKRRQADSTLREPSYVIEKAGQADPKFAKDVPSHHASSEPNSSGFSGHSSSSNTDPSSNHSSLPHNDNASGQERTGPAEGATATEPVSSDGHGDGSLTFTSSSLTDSVILPSSVVESSTGSKEAPIPLTQEQKQKQQEPIGVVKPTLLVMRNIAAVECGAKLLKASPSARHAASILVDNNDMYMNQPCASEKWFILETCEPVQLGTIQIANYELFSSRFKTFKVYVSDRFPAKEWELLGTFQAFDVKGLQSFDLKGGSDRLIKYVKFEMLDHYGNEHFCPITMVRLFGLVSDDLDDAAAEAELEVVHVPEAVPIVAAESRGSQLNDLGVVEETISGQNPEVDPNFSQNTLTAPQGTSLGVTTTPDFSAPSVQPGEDAPLADSKPTAVSHDHRVGGTQTSVNSPGVQDGSAEPSHHQGAAHKRHSRKIAPDASATQGRTADLEPPLGFLQKATSFILNVLRSAVGSPPDSSSTDSRSSPNAGLQSRAQLRGSSLADLTLRNDDFYTVIYLFTSVCPSLGHRPYALAADGLSCPRPPLRRPHQHLDRGLEYLAFCIRALDHQLQSNTPLPFRLRSPHRAWAPCTSSAHLLNLTITTLELPDSGSSTPCLPCLLSAYRNITRTFSEWSSVSAPLGHTYLRRLIRHHRSSLPARFQYSDGLPAFPLFASGRGERPSLGTASPSTPTRSNGSGNIEQPSVSPPRPPPPPPQQQQQPEEEEELVSVPSSSPAPQLPSTASVGTPSPTEEFVLPASIGGSRKETAYMRLNNKVRQIEANVSVSMRYLQELSQSYKRQTEKLSRSFNLTTAWLQATAKGAEERDMQQQLRIDALERRLSRLLEALAEQGLIVVSTSPAKTNSTDSILEIRRKDSGTEHKKSCQFGENSDSLTGQISTFIWTAFFQPSDSQVVLHPLSPEPAFALLPHPLLGEGKDREAASERFAETDDRRHVIPFRQQAQCPVLSANGLPVDVSNSVCLAVHNTTLEFVQRSPYLPARKTLSWQRQGRPSKKKHDFEWVNYYLFLFHRRWDYGALVNDLYRLCAQANRRLNSGFSWLLGVIYLTAKELAITVTAHLLLALLTQLIIFRLLSRRILAEIVRQQQPMCRAESDQCARGSTYQPINSAAVQTELNTDSFFERLSDVHLTGAYFPNADSKCSSYTPSLLSTSLDNASLIESQSSASTSATGSVLALQRAGDSTQSTESFTLLQPSAYALPLQVHHRSSALSKTDDRLDPMHNLNSTDALLGNLTGSEVSVTPSNPISRELLPDVSKSSPAFQPQRKRRLKRLKDKVRKQVDLLPRYVS
uniref:SUN domain-containing protein n=1 Tax=Schistocephalus solidus TaxID=70667 RepID=A0A0V0J239_SCHSO